MRPFTVPTRTSWAICLLAGVADAALALAYDFGLAVDGTLLRNLALLALLGMFSFYYSRRPATRRFAVLTAAILYVAIYSIVVVLLNYLLTATDLPMQDRMFVHWDRSLGLDWLAWLAWVNAHPQFGRVLTFAYQSSMPQVVIAIAVLAFMKRDAALSEYMNLFWITTVTTVVLAALLPAEGGYGYLKPDPLTYAQLTPDAGIVHLHQYLGLRDGSFRLIDLNDLNGLITFPSFHAELAVITAWAFWSVRWARFPAVALNALVVISTPTNGGHYFVDALAGSSLAVLFILLHRKSVLAALSVRLFGPRPFSTLWAYNMRLAGTETYDNQSLRDRPRQEPGQPSAADAGLVSEARG